MNNLTEAGYAWENNRLNAHLRDYDVSEARDRAIEVRAEELLEGDYAPFGETVFGMFCDEFDLRDVLGDVLPHLVAGDEAQAGHIIAERLRRYADKLANDEAALQIDHDWEHARDDAAADLADKRDFDGSYVGWKY